MADVHSKKTRSYNMSQIHSKNTSPEVGFRKHIWNNGIRGYRIYSNVKGKPDLYFPKYKLAVFIDGCFWHKCPKDYVRPRTNKKFWDSKIDINVARDISVNKDLKQKGISILRFWEHEMRGKNNLKKAFERLKSAHGRLKRQTKP